MARAVICMLRTDVHDHILYKVKLDELRRLAETLDYEIVKDFVQTRSKPYSRYLIGKGKVKEIKEFIKKRGIDTVIFYNTLSSSQKLNLTRDLGCDIIDRYELILEIFDAHASDNLSKLQIELARMQKLLPYFKLQAKLKYLTEHPFFRGMGEYAYHSKLRMLTARMSRIRERIQKLKIQKAAEIKRRKELGYPIVCISGYYNAGKTSLFNALTGSDKEVSPRPFSTLSSKYQRRFLSPEESLLFVDTIGFVIDLDPTLIGSFELNLYDIVNADVVLFLLEMIDPIQVLSLKLGEGLKLLRSLGVDKERIIIVFNKLDLVDEEYEEEIRSQLEAFLTRYDWICISALERRNLEKLIELIRRKMGSLREKVWN
jgi:GTP-binding protein HflX